MPARQITCEELKQHDGRKGSPSYIGYRGLVYDVSESFLWMGGRHQATHLAGTDLSGELGQAPHGADLLQRFPVVGILLDPRPESSASSTR